MRHIFLSCEKLAKADAGGGWANLIIKLVRRSRINEHKRFERVTVDASSLFSSRSP